MGKWFIVYSSLTGNTEKVGQAILAGAPEGSVAKNCREVEDFFAESADFDVIVVGYWLKRGGADPLTMKILPQITGKRVISFETHGTMPNTEHAVTAFARAAYQLGGDCEILGTFACQGKINPKLIARRQDAPADDPHGPSEKNQQRWAVGAERPNEEDLLAAKDFAAAMQRKIEIIARYREKQA
jgi:flavodoxin